MFVKGLINDSLVIFLKVWLPIVRICSSILKGDRLKNDHLEGTDRSEELCKTSKKQLT